MEGDHAGRSGQAVIGSCGQNDHVDQTHHVCSLAGKLFINGLPNGSPVISVEVSLTAGGSYALCVVDAKGCIADESFALTDLSTDLLKAELLIAPEGACRRYGRT